MPKNADVFELPYERGTAETEESAAASLFEVLASDPEFREETPGIEANEPAGETELIDDPEEDPEAEGEGEPEEPEDPEEDPETEGEESEEGEGAETGEEEAEYEVTLPGGEKTKVPLSELIRGYSREADYTRKTQALAEFRRAEEARLDAEAQRVATVYGRKLEALELALREMEPQEPDWDTLRREDPAEFAAQFAEHQRHRERKAAVQAERARVQQELAEAQERRLAAVLETERAKLIEAIPEWQDPAVASEGKKRLADYATRTYGYTPEDLSQVYDHRLMVILDKARRYDELQVKGEGLKGKAKAQQTLTPGGRKSAPRKGGKARKHRDARNRLVRSGRVEDAAAVILDMIPDD